jgi:serine protease Do
MPRGGPFLPGPGFDRGPRIGATIHDLPPTELARQQTGVVIGEVQPGSPAERAGLRPRDVIVEFDGERVRSMRQFVRLVEETVPGREVKAVVLRGGARTELRVTPQVAGGPGPQGWGAPERDAPFDGQGWDAPAPGSPPDASSRRGWLGVSVQPLTPQLGTHFGAREGMLVASVQEGSPGARAGLRAGDVIVTVNGRPVRSRMELVREMDAAAGGAGTEASLGVVRDRKTITIKVRLGDQGTGPGPVNL